MAAVQTPTILAPERVTEEGLGMDPHTISQVCKDSRDIVQKQALRRFQGEDHNQPSRPRGRPCTRTSTLRCFLHYDQGTDCLRPNVGYAERLPAPNAVLMAASTWSFQGMDPHTISQVCKDSRDIVQKHCVALRGKVDTPITTKGPATPRDCRCLSSGSAVLDEGITIPQKIPRSSNLALDHDKPKNESLTPESKDLGKKLTSFHLFNMFPQELQDDIWTAVSATTGSTSAGD
ncbi:unnamed protein product [Clonostachys chloroleuca]|uniref:Uncharacterized protein n=1 Tax=Clonostachys chloroleuca TaxID=1926264 RepID=A0AA35M679_9HYPO|nr:unnamed protein product [Clonostachys chloroleuca]